jgi:hypothetical protein
MPRWNVSIRIAEQFGFTCRGKKGSHQIYTRDGVRELLNFQEVGGMAKLLSGKTTLYDN